ncbi:MAG TPA: universal stress protein [Gemmatimonadaceae bacterium]|jgi:nucleotide-binding universal stress UspA family protein|nr:universal stress protein [Gemmatimonadaceae bacterium]
MRSLEQPTESFTACSLSFEVEPSSPASEGWTPPSSVLIATDGSLASDAAVVVGRRLAWRAGQEAELVTVFERPITYEPPLVAGLSDIELELAAKQSWWYEIEQQRRRLAPAALRWPVSFEEGRPARAIADVAASKSRTLIVMGSGGHGLLERTVGRELALSVIRRGVAPVLAVHSDQSRLPASAVAAIDFTPASIEAAHLALHLLGDRGTLYLVNVRDGEKDDRSRTNVPDEATARLLLEEVRRTLEPPPGVTIEDVVMFGDPAHAVLTFAAEQDVDLIACGMHGYSAFERFLVGSVSTRLLRSSHCSVLVAPPGQEGIGWR